MPIPDRICFGHEINQNIDSNIPFVVVHCISTRRAFVDVLFENCAVRFVRRRSSTAFAGIVKAAAATAEKDATAANGAAPPPAAGPAGAPAPVAAVVAIEVTGDLPTAHEV